MRRLERREKQGSALRVWPMHKRRPLPIGRLFEGALIDERPITWVR